MAQVPVTSKYSQMLYSNLGSCIFSSFTLIASGRITHAIGFAFNSVPIWKYLAVPISNVYAGIRQYEALKYASFPVQMLGKSLRMMSVMTWGMMVPGKRVGAESVCLGIWTGLIIVFIIEYYLSASFTSGQEIAETQKQSAATESTTAWRWHTFPTCTASH